MATWAAAIPLALVALMAAVIVAAVFIEPQEAPEGPAGGSTGVPATATPTPTSTVGLQRPSRLPAGTPSPSLTAELRGLIGPTAVADSDGIPPLYFRNCAAARRAGVAPMFDDEPGYRTGLDRNRDGVACE